jgi:hypothetical protein
MTLPCVTCIHVTAWLTPELDNNGNVYTFDTFATDLHIMPYKTANSTSWVNIATGATTLAYQE